MRKPLNTPAAHEWLVRLFKLVNARIIVREKIAWAMINGNVPQEMALRAELRKLDNQITQHEISREQIYV